MPTHHPIHRWSLVDKSGKTRLTCEAPRNPKRPFDGANAMFKELRGGAPIPERWTIIDRGPVPLFP